jgi:hypothetical protein
MTRIVTYAYRYKRRPRTAVSGRALVVAAVMITLLGGCEPNVLPTDQELALRGYWYHDGNHQGGASGATTPQAIYAATHGVWLWPPAENTRPGR